MSRSGSAAYEASIILAEAIPQVAARPGLRFVYARPAHCIAFAGGVGLAPFAAGTFGTLLAFPIHALLDAWADSAMQLIVLICFFIAGAWACDRTGRALGVADHGAMVWDETVAFLLVLFFTPPGWMWQILAFALFRFFDIAKPAPIRYFDRTLKNGFGVMFDDLLAAGYTLFALALVKILVD